MDTTTPAVPHGFDFGAAGCAFLAEASRLLADSLDYNATLATVAGLALPTLGAWCIVDLVEDDGSMRRLAVVHPDPARQSLARRLTTGWPPEADDPLGVPVVVRTRKPQVIAGVTDDVLRRAAHGEGNLRILRQLGIGSLVAVPMLARGRVYGAMTFVSPEPGEYGDTVIDLAEDLARRAAMAIENARLYRAAERARADAEGSSRAKSGFLAAMSHELRTPINAVVGYVDLMELELAGPLTEAQREQLGRIRGSAGHLLEMVDEVLDLARVESGQLPVSRERALAQEAVEEALLAVRPAADARGVTLADDCAAERPAWYLADVGRVRQVLENLLSNAVKFSRPGGAVRVGCSLSDSPPSDAWLGGGPWVAVEVEDAGVGIAPEDVAAVWEPFRQVDEGHTRSAEGTGLGLTVARQLARLMGGDVTLRSAPGQGSCFTLWLPAAVPQGVPGERRDASERRRAAEALATAGRMLTTHMDEVAAAYLRRLRGDGRLEHAAEGTDVDLLDHAATLIADVGQAMVVLGGQAQDAPELLRDGSRIQRLVAELHAQQRQRLGWTEEELRRDFCLLREEVEHCIRTHLRGEGAEAAALTAGRLLRQGERIGVHAYRVAAGAAG